MRFIGVVLLVSFVIGVALTSSGCTVKIENSTQNGTHEATKAPNNLPQYPNANGTYYCNIRALGQVAAYQTNDSQKQVSNRIL